MAHTNIAEMANPSFLMSEINVTTFEDRPVPDEIFDDEIIVSVQKTGICGSDIHFLTEGRIAHLVVEAPMVLGHESSGVVTKVGRKVTDLQPGDRVALEPGATCRVCVHCKTGRYQLCKDIRFAATPPTDGTLARFYRLPGDVAYKLPDSMTLEDGAMIEPLAVGIHALASVGQLRSTQSVVVFGAGPVGLLALAAARALGASRAIACDIVPSRLAFAKSYAATDAWAPIAKHDGEGATAYAARNAQAMKTELGLGDGVDLSLDASGAPASIQTGLLLVKPGGVHVQVGMGHPDLAIPVVSVLAREVTIRGSFRYGPGDYKLAIALVAAGKIDLRPLVTHRYAFEDAEKAFTTTRSGRGEDGEPAIKVIISGPGIAPDSK